MTTENTPAQIARIMALVIVGIALLATVVSSVLVTLWVLLVAVPLLATLRLVLNLLDGAAQSNSANIARIMALVIIGISLLAAGVSSVMTLWTSSFARYMYIEDLMYTTNLGLDEAAVFATTRLTPADRGIIVVGGLMAVVGAAALIAAAVLARRRRRSGR